MWLTMGGGELNLNRNDQVIKGTSGCYGMLLLETAAFFKLLFITVFSEQ